MGSDENALNAARENIWMQGGLWTDLRGRFHSCPKSHSSNELTVQGPKRGGFKKINHVLKFNTE